MWNKVFLAPVERRIDDAIHWIPMLNLRLSDSVVGFVLMLIHWIVIYPVDSVIQFPTENRAHNVSPLSRTRIYLLRKRVFVSMSQRNILFPQQMLLGENGSKVLHF